MILGLSWGDLEINFSVMKNSCLDGVLMVEALYGLGGFFKVFWLEFSWIF
jgi:hypothetical protein